jgi:hypothetical protein
LLELGLAFLSIPKNASTTIRDNAHNNRVFELPLAISTILIDIAVVCRLLFYNSIALKTDLNLGGAPDGYWMV